jgi:hypothetical protein
MDSGDFHFFFFLFLSTTNLTLHTSNLSLQIPHPLKTFCGNHAGPSIEGPSASFIYLTPYTSHLTPHHPPLTISPIFLFISSSFTLAMLRA